MSDILLARMAQLRKKAKDTNPCAYSEVRTTSPLSLFLAIYTKASTECYVDHMQGAKVLLDWLTVGNMPLDYNTAKYPQIEDTSFILPRLLTGYDAGELAKLLAPQSKYSDFNECLDAVAKARKAIYFTMKDMI